MRRLRTRGSGSGTADSSAAVYGCLGALKSSSVSASSTIRPTYITATRLLMCAHHAQVVRDEQVGQPEVGLQIEQQVQDLRLHRDVERRDRLVGDDQARMQRQRARDADALALAAAEGVREAAHVLRAQPDPAQQIGHPLLALPAVRHAVDQQRLADEVEQRHARIERGERVLEDHLHLAPQRAQLRGRAAGPDRPPSRPPRA